MAEHPNYDHILGRSFTVGDQLYEIRRSAAKGDLNKIQPIYVLWHWDDYKNRWVGAGTFLDAATERVAADQQAAWHSNRSQIFAALQNHATRGTPVTNA